MYLDKLIIRKNDSEIVREIRFKKGLNLILDATSKETATDSGNSVGKTTFLRIIDFCLGGKEETIYKDKEFKKNNQKIFDYLVNNKVEFELFLKKDGETLSISRSIKGRSLINGRKQKDKTEFNENLFQYLFGLPQRRPTLRQLIPKFIRIEGEQISNALYFLHNATKETEYESIFLFLFGYRKTEILAQKCKNVSELNKLIKSSPNHNIGELEQQLALINNNISQLNAIKSSLDFSVNVEADLKNLKKVQVEINALKSTVAELDIKISMNTETLKKLDDAKTKIGVNTIAKLYEHAKLEVPNLKIQFEEVLKFHNQMISNKKKFINNMMVGMELSLKNYQEALAKKLENETEIIKKMQMQGNLGEYDSINEALQEKNRDKGYKEGQLEQLRQLDQKISRIKESITQINQEIDEFLENLKENLKVFNVHFQEYSKALYGEEYYLYPIKKRNPRSSIENSLLDISNMTENTGTGKKKAQISALDLAYLKYSEEMKYKVPYFVLHDQLETVYENQVKTLFNLANSLEGQFVVAVLSDKLHNIDASEINANCILCLSQADKLFKIL